MKEDFESHGAEGQGDSAPHGADAGPAGLSAMGASRSAEPADHCLGPDGEGRPSAGTLETGGATFTVEVDAGVIGICGSVEERSHHAELALPPDERPIIRVHTGRMNITYAEAEERLAADGYHYERSGLPVRVSTDTVTGETTVREVNAIELTRTLDRLAAWQRWDKRLKAWVPCDPQERLCRVMAHGCRPGALKPLAGLVRQPHLRADGTLCASAGYDEQTQLYGVFEASDHPVIESPTRADAEAALARLKDLLREFPFAEDHDEAAALAAILTAVVRPVLPVAPMVHVRAHSPGSGKSYLTELIAAFATPTAVSSLTYPTSNDECDKLLLAEFARSPGVVVFDNCTADLAPFKKICTALTEDRIGGRLLGTSKTVSVSTRALLMSSGNNVGPVADMARRCVTITLDVKEELPAARKFTRPSLMDDVRRDRAKFVMDALTIVRAWIACGRPASGATPLASYGEWSTWCCEPLRWLCVPDPVHSVYTAMKEDPDHERLGVLIAAWHARYGNKPVRVRDLLEWVGGLFPESAEVKELFAEVAGGGGGGGDSINRRRLGWWLKHHVGKVAAGLRIERAGRMGSVESWRVVRV